MKIAVSSVCWMRDSLTHALEEARKAGFTAFEPLVFPEEEICAVHGDLRKMTAAELKGRLDEYGMAPAGLHIGGFITGDADRQRSFTDYAKTAIDAAAEIGCPHIVATGPSREQEPFAPLIDVIKELAEHARGTGVRIALENHYDNWLQSIADFEKVFEQIDAPEVGITLDSGHFTSADVDPAAVACRFGDKIIHVHIKDHIGTESVRLGEGDTDNEALVRALKARNYDGYLSQELEVEDTEDADAAARDGFEYMSALAGI